MAHIRVETAPMFFKDEVLHSHILKALLRVEIFISCTAQHVGMSSCYTATG